MTTVDKTLADNIVIHDGWYNGDTDNTFGDNPRTIRIWEYQTPFGTAYKCVDSKKDSYYDGSLLPLARLYFNAVDAN